MKKTKVTAKEIIAQTNISLDDRIRNINEGNFDERLQKFISMGETKGYVLPNTGDNVLIVASSPDQLDDIVTHWMSRNYRGNYEPALYFHPPVSEQHEFSDADLVAMKNKALEGAKFVDLAPMVGWLQKEQNS